MGDQVMRHVFSAGDQLAGGKRAARDRQIGRWEGETEPVAVANSQSILLGGGLGSIAVAHFKRVKDMLLNVLGVRFSTGGLDDQAKDVVIEVAVLDLRADRAGDLE